MPRSMFNKLVNREMNQVADSVISAVARIRIQSPSAKIYVMTLPNLTNLHAGYTLSLDQISAPDARALLAIRYP